MEPYDEDEETTYIDLAILLRENCIKKWLIVPIISLFTLFVFPILLYWKPEMRKRWFYTPAESINRATHIYIEGLDENKQIVRLKDYT